ncbi:MAG: rhodanese-like domain-containing protein [Acidimicrobiia bacterium]|nr:rhodanese-like domain-containing protein [Acidimicrobiia bacterium]
MTTKFKSVDPQTAKRIYDGGAHMVDVRSEGEWSAGHVEGSDRISVGRISAHSVGRADTVIVVCGNGKRSKRAAKKLVKEGYQTYHLAGGLTSWHDLGLPLKSSNGARPTVL